jgi:hypothetical protein
LYDFLCSNILYDFQCSTIFVWFPVFHYFCMISCVPLFLSGDNRNLQAGRITELVSDILGFRWNLEVLVMKVRWSGSSEFLIRKRLGTSSRNCSALFCYSEFFRDFLQLYGKCKFITKRWGMFRVSAHLSGDLDANVTSSSFKIIKNQRSSYSSVHTRDFYQTTDITSLHPRPPNHQRTGIVTRS